MLVKFISSESGEMVMMADVAGPLLKAMGKACTARGVITQAEMLPAIGALNHYLDAMTSAEHPLSEEEEAEIPPMARPVGIKQRAWPFLQMLGRTAHASKQPGQILWEAAADFENQGIPTSA